MSSFLYNNARSLFATGQINWPAVNARAVLVNGAYAPSRADISLADVPSGAIMKDVLMTDLGQSNGICYGVIPQFNAFTSGSIVTGLLIYLSAGDPADAHLIYYSDDGIGFPFKPLGFNYAVSFDQAAGGFFQA